LARPFFFLCLLEESSALSKAGVGFLPLAGALCGGGGTPGVASLMASGAAAGLSIGAVRVVLGGAAGFSHPLLFGWTESLMGADCAGAGVSEPGKTGGEAGAEVGAGEAEEGCTISMPNELALEAGAGVASGTLVTTAAELPAALAAAVGTS
jgi:hypothetical protein